jgi:flagellar hook protein FlgE
MSSTVDSIAMSGLAAARAQLDSSAHNVANVQTPRFQRQVVAQAAQEMGGVSTRIQRSPVAGADLAQDIITQLSASYVYRANLGVIETQSEMSGSLLDLSA